MQVESQVKIRPPQSTYEDFFRSTFPKVRAATARIIGADGSEDLAIEALARAFARWNVVKKMEYPQAWTIRVGVNLALDQVRRKEVPRSTLWVRDESDQVILRADLTKAIRHLPKRQQEVVVLRHVVDLSEADVSQALGISEGSVKTHLHRAIAGLRKALSDEERPKP